MKLTEVDANSLKKIGTVAGVVSVIVVSFYLTGLYRNVLQIRKLKQEGSKPIKVEDE